MSENEKLKALRERLDKIDAELLPLFRERMRAVEEVAAVKRDNNLPILDARREQEIIDKAAGDADDAFRAEVSLLMRTILALSKGRQRKKLIAASGALLPPPRLPLRESIACAFQGVKGAWSEQALARCFPEAEKLAVEQFEEVFLAVRDKRAAYGVVPIENSQTGAIGENYDLLRKYGCYIVGRVWIDIKQCLLAPEGTELKDIRRVYSHPQGLEQCGRFLRGKGWELIACRNTASAAELVSRPGESGGAAIASRYAAECYGLAVAAPDIMDSAGNRTSFIVIAPEPEYDESSDMVAVTFTTAHRSGALCETLMPFMAQGINLARIESRPGTAGSYRFFADLEGNILDKNVAAALRQAEAACEYFEVIGCYKTIK